MKTLIIGGSGHIGGFLAPMCAADGQEVVIASSGRRPADKLPRGIRRVQLQYNDIGTTDGLDRLMAAERPEAVVDILQGRSREVYDACRKAGVRQLVVCGSVWMLGRAKTAPTPEVTQGPCAFKGYAARYAEMLEVRQQAIRDKFQFTAVLPPNICGPGKIPLECSGGRALETHKAHMAGREVVLPWPGTNLIGPCDAQDVARVFLGALRAPEKAAGEIFNAGSNYALTAEQFVRVYAEIYRTRIPIRFADAREYAEKINPNPGSNYHFLEHMCPDISKAARLLGYRPEFTPEETLARAVKWMADEGLL